jgi:hypothetical protein
VQIKIVIAFRIFGDQILTSAIRLGFYFLYKTGDNFVHQSPHFKEFENSSYITLRLAFKKKISNMLSGSSNNQNNAHTILHLIWNRTYYRHLECYGGSEKFTWQQYTNCPDVALHVFLCSCCLSFPDKVAKNQSCL